MKEATDSMAQRSLKSVAMRDALDMARGELSLWTAISVASQGLLAMLVAVTTHSPVLWNKLELGWSALMAIIALAALDRKRKYFFISRAKLIDHTPLQEWSQDFEFTRYPAWSSLNGHAFLLLHLLVLSAITLIK